MTITLWEFKPPEYDKKRWLLLSQGSLPALQSDTHDTSLQRTASMCNDGDSSILMHVPSTCKFHAEIPCSRMFLMYGHTFVRTCASRAFPAFLAVCERRGVV